MAFSWPLRTLALSLFLASSFSLAGQTTPAPEKEVEKEIASTSSCHVSIVEITPDGFTRAPAAVAEFQSSTAKGGECADEMKTHVKDFARNCHSPNHVLAEIEFEASAEKSVEAELAMECGASSKRNPASNETDHVNRYINEAYNQIQTSKDSHPLTDVQLHAPKSALPSSAGFHPLHSSTQTNGVVYEGENVHAGKQKWLQTESTPTDGTVPDEVVEARLENRAIATADDRSNTAAQNAYIQEFIRNAKADGWSIQVKDGQIQVAPRRRVQ